VGWNLFRKSKEVKTKLGKRMNLENLAEELIEAKERISQLEKIAAEGNELLFRKEKDLRQAVGKYRTTLEKENPDILPELIGGESVEELDGSLEKAKVLTDKVKKGLEEKAKEIHIPTGAPERASMDIESLSSTEKIKEGLNRKMK
jgi:hypothetical protein